MVKADQLAHLVSTWTAARVEVEGLSMADGSISFQVRPPTTAEALSVYGLLPSAASGSSSDEAALKRIVFGWLPLRLATAMFARKHSWSKRAELLMALLTAGLPSQDEAKKQLGDVEERARERSWTSVLAEYSAVYHTDPLREPWSYFLEWCSVLDEIRARQEVSQMTWYGAAKTGKADPIFERARMKDAPGEVEEPAFMKDPNWQAEQLGKVQRLLEKRGRA